MGSILDNRHFRFTTHGLEKGNLVPTRLRALTMGKEMRVGYVTGFNEICIRNPLQDSRFLVESRFIAMASTQSLFELLKQYFRNCLLLSILF